MGDKLLQFFQLIGRSCDHKFVYVGIKETMSVKSSTVGIQLMIVQIIRIFPDYRVA